MKELHLDVLNCVGVGIDGCALVVSDAPVQLVGFQFKTTES